MTVPRASELGGSKLRLMIEGPVVTTPRLLLRPWAHGDRTPFALMNADPVVMEYFPRLLTTGESESLVDRYVESWQLGYGLWAVERRDEGQFIGFIGFSQPSWSAPFTPCIEIGWRLCAASWGQGFATEGAQAALVWGAQNVEFPSGEVVSFTTRVNLRSRRVMEKLGFSRDERDDFDHPLVVDGPLRPHVLYRRRMT